MSRVTHRRSRSNFKRRLELDFRTGSTVTVSLSGDSARAVAPARGFARFAAARMLTISQVTKAFGGRTLFEEASLQVNRGDRVGLVGPNGAGKSTLFSLILGEASPDKGTIAIEKNAAIGFLPQETAAAGDETVLELALAVSPELVHAQKVINEHEAGHGADDAGY